ncbi:MAG: TIGR02270 family protein [Pseudomonadota bacterium]
MNDSKRHIPLITDQHTEEAAFLWLLRDGGAVSDPHYSLKDLTELDNRVDAHLDGLRIAGEVGWEICLKALEIGEPGEVFAASVLAFESGNGQRIDAVLGTGLANEENFRALISAIGWIDYKQISPLIRHMLVAKSSDFRRVGIAASAVHRQDPGQILQHAIESDDALMSARALKAAGELKRKDLLPAFAKPFNSEDETCRFWAAWSAVLLGDRLQAKEALKQTVTSESQFRDRALQMVLRTMDGKEAQSWLKGLAQNPDWLRDVVVGAGVSGDPAFIPWLIQQMEIPELARVAGEAFSMITGVDLAYEDMEGEMPEGFEAGPTENPEDEDVEMDADEDLPWPAPELIQAWWEKNRPNFQIGARYLAGQPISAAQCKKVLISGFQRQRNAAALEFALIDPRAPLFPTKAPGFVQQRLLGI